MPSAASRYARNAALMGLCIAVALEVWRQIAMARAPVGEAQEGVWLLAALVAVTAGAPLSLLASPFIDSAAVPLFEWTGIDPFYLLDLALVADWAIIGWVIGWQRHEPSPPASEG